MFHCRHGCPIMDRTSFNIQNSIPHKSQKTKATPETNRAKEFQRGTAGVPKSAKEGARDLAEDLDTGLGCGDRAFESHYSDQVYKKNRLKRRFFCVIKVLRWRQSFAPAPFLHIFAYSFYRRYHNGTGLTGASTVSLIIAYEK